MKKSTGAASGAILALATVLLVLSAAAGSAAPASRAGGRGADESRVEQIGARLLVVVQADSVPDWPPAFVLSAVDAPNAWAYEKVVDGGTRRIVDVSRGMLARITLDSDDLLAFVLAHELAHHLLGHVGSRGGGRAALVQAAFSREQELAADRKGMEIVLAAGYSFQEAVAICPRMTEAGEEYSSFEGMGLDHPSWAERCQMLDPVNSRLWASLGAYQNGVFFLVIEQYANAIPCFDAVVREFPQCAEGYANRGYAYLMSHYRRLDSEDLDDLGIGQVAVGAFYRRTDRLRGQTRGVDTAALDRAIKDLARSIEIDPALTLAASNLGVAHLLHPVQRDTAAAVRYCRQAAVAASRDPALDHLSRSSVYANYAVAAMAAGDRARSVEYLNLADSELGMAGFDCERKPFSCGLLGAIRFNRAMLLASIGLAEKDKVAKRLYLDFLRMTNSASNWWPVAYKRYSRLCGSLGETPVEETSLSRASRAAWSPVTGVSLPGGGMLSLADDVSSVAGLGREWQQVSIAPNDPSAYELRSDGMSVTILNGTVAAIRIQSPDGPPVQLRSAGAGGSEVAIRVGMPDGELERLMSSQDYTPGTVLLLPGMGGDRQSVRGFRYYYNIGLAVRSENGMVVAVIVVPLRMNSRAG